MFSVVCSWLRTAVGVVQRLLLPWQLNPTTTTSSSSSSIQRDDDELYQHIPLTTSFLYID